MQDLKKARVLLVNDDGIDAPGIRILEQLVRRYTDDVWVIAPDEEKSGSSHSLSITLPVRIRKVADKRYAIKGTPTDCVLLAVHELMRDRPPDLLLSGINRGANLAEDITYSGTAAAAMEGMALGVPSIALSQVFNFGSPIDWAASEQYTLPVLEFLLAQSWDPECFINVNFPAVPVSQINGMRITRQGRRPPGSFTPERRIDGRDVPYYWITLTHKVGNEQPGTDLAAIRDKAISITPTQLDLTAHALGERLGRALENTKIDT